MGKTIKRTEILTRIDGIRRYAEAHGATTETLMYLERCKKAVMQCETSEHRFIEKHANNSSMKVQ